MHGIKQGMKLGFVSVSASARVRTGLALGVQGIAEDLRIGVPHCPRIMIGS
jgi:hypothetical protein